MTTADGPVGGPPRCATLTTRRRCAGLPASGADVCAQSPLTLEPAPRARAAANAAHPRPMRVMVIAVSSLGVMTRTHYCVQRYDVALSTGPRVYRGNAGYEHSGRLRSPAFTTTDDGGAMFRSTQSKSSCAWS